jgi:hypothetical protein
MLVRKICIFLIIIILLTEIYFNYCVELEVESSKFTNTELEKVKEIIIVNKEPWDKIKESKDINSYYINIKDFDEVKYMEWKELIPDIEYDINSKLLKIKSKDEERAISIVNLMISNMKEDIEMDEILSNDLINKSIRKSRKYNVIFKKLLTLVIENNKKDEETISNNNIDTFDIMNENSNNDNTLDNNLNNISNKVSNKVSNKGVNSPVVIQPEKPKHIKPEDYNYDGFNNSHNNIFKKDKLIRNNLSSGAYMGKQYARPFRY